MRAHTHNPPPRPFWSLSLPQSHACVSCTRSNTHPLNMPWPKQLPRLHQSQVRARRIAMDQALAAAADGGDGGGPADDDLVSEAPSLISGFSMYTGDSPTW